MKKIIRNAFVLLVSALLIGSMTACQKKEENTGAWQETENQTVTPELEEKFNKAIENLNSVAYKPLKLLATQTVSGTNYKFLCEAMTIVPGSETYECEVVIYEDLNGNISLVSIDNNAENIQIPNPWTVCANLDEAKEKAGFEFEAPLSLAGYEGTEIEVSDNIIQILYGDWEKDLLTLRKSKVKNEDISGDYSEYKNVKTETIDNYEVTFKYGDDGLLYVAIWSNGDYSYSLQSNYAFSENTAKSIISEVK